MATPTPNPQGPFNLYFHNAPGHGAQGAQYLWASPNYNDILGYAQCCARVLGYALHWTWTYYRTPDGLGYITLKAGHHQQAIEVAYLCIERGVMGTDGQTGTAGNESYGKKDGGGGKGAGDGRSKDDAGNGEKGEGGGDQGFSLPSQAAGVK